jgi:hypothetical protein
MIEAGKYYWINPSITAEHFPITGHRKENVEVHLIHFNRIIKSAEEIAELDRMGLRPATLVELLAFGAKYPDVQMQFPIIALGSVWRNPDGFRVVPGLWGDSDKRSLSLHWCEYEWENCDRFLAVRK